MDIPIMRPRVMSWDEWEAWWMKEQADLRQLVADGVIPAPRRNMPVNVPFILHED